MWDRLDQQSRSIGDLTRSQAATEANLAALAEATRTGFDQINASLNRVLERESRPTNWVGIGSLFAVVVGALIGFVALQTDPVKAKADQNFIELQKQTERDISSAAFHGQVTTMLGVLEQYSQRHIENERELHYLRGRVSSLEERVNDVDRYGSRRWVDAQEP